MAAAGSLIARVRGWWARREAGLLPIIFSDTAPLDLRIVGKMLFHAALVGVAAGFAGAAFFFGLETVQRLLLEQLAGYVPLRAHGETFALSEHRGTFKPWLLVILPALGGLACGLITQLAPEARGGGGDAMIDAFHHKGGMIRRRVIGVKALASLVTLGSGGAGGREGPTMLIGGALGSWVGRALRVSSRERRILLVAGVAAGISAVFRTPLGAALLAVEVLYKDGFESDALIPSVLASVIAYSVVISIYGESTMFAHAPRYPFVPAHLPLYGMVALLVALEAAAFVSVLERMRRLFEGLRGPAWLRPAIGGLALGVLITPVIAVVGRVIGIEGQGLGIVGGGYGAVQMAISGSRWLPEGWTGVELLALLSVTKVLAASFTISSGGSAGDFAPSLAIGGMMGGAFGRAAALLIGDPRLDPGAFALVGMGAFYGGIAHAPLSALVLVCEMAGNYDLLVPLMLAQGIAFVALRKRALYHAQVATQRDSPVHRDALLLEMMRTVQVKELMTSGREWIGFLPTTPAAEMLSRLGESSWQDVFPVIGAEGKMVGIVDAAALRVLAAEGAEATWAVAADLMLPPVVIRPEDDLRLAMERLLANNLREIPVVGPDLQVVGFLDEAELARVYVRAAARAESD